MKIVTYNPTIEKNKVNRPVITIGSFDGVHKGHQQIIKQVKDRADQSNVDHVIISFDPHPRQVIYPRDTELKLLSDTSEKAFLLNHYGVRNLAIVPFTVEFSQLNADEYIENFIVSNFQPSAIVIGYDHKFGLNRQGDINYLRWYANTYKYDVQEISEHLVNSITVSSSKIRKAIEEGKLDDAKDWLGHPYILRGAVIHGDKLGTSIGFPTANIQPMNPLKLIPPDGIYAVNIHIKNQIHKAVLYIGNKPTLGKLKQSIEAHIFDFHDQIYDEVVMIEFHKYIRPDSKFDTIDAMTQQISKDKSKAEVLLKHSQSAFV